MPLLIDVGNTQTHVAVFESGKINYQWEFGTQSFRTSDEWGLTLRQALRERDLILQKLDFALISSVVPEIDSRLAEGLSGLNYRFVTHRDPFQFEIISDSPEQIGADRLVNAEAAVREYGTPCVILDAGTATTICGVSRDQNFLGGSIMPGLRTLSRSLSEKTSRLFEVELKAPEKVMGTNTYDAIQSGLVFGFIEMVQGMIKKTKIEMGEIQAKVILTGGMGGLIRSHLSELDFFDSQLTFKGLAYLYGSIHQR